LDANSRLTVDLDHVPVVLGVDRSAEHTSPKAALCGEIGGVEHDYLVDELHPIIIAATAGTRTPAWSLGDGPNRRSAVSRGPALDR
jgi:hypothetical protein